MSLNEFQSALAQLIIDPEFAAKVRSEHRALTSYTLDPHETRRLVAIARNDGLQVARRIHRFFRIHAILQSLPLTVRLLGETRLRSLAESFWQSVVAPRNYYYAREANRFGEFVRERVERGTIEDPYLSEVLAFELAALDLAVSQQLQHEGADPAPRAPPVQTADWRPRLCAHFRLVAFDHAPGALLSGLERRVVPEGLTVGRHYLLLDGSAPPAIRLVPTLHQLGSVLESCNGDLRADEVCARTQVSLADLQRLVVEGYITAGADDTREARLR